MGLQGDSEMSLTYPKDPEGQPGHIAIRGFAKLEMNSKADSPRPSSQASRQFKALLIVIAIYGLFKTAVYGLVDWDSNYFLVPGSLEFSFLQAVKQGQPYVDWDFTRENIEEVFL